MIVPDKILELVDRFSSNLESYKQGKYNETQVRREFIDPLLEELGWDIANKQGYAEAYKEVVHEDVVKVGGATKAPDYSFRIGGVRKFFLEAKKPSINIREDTHPAYQLRRYAWSAKLPLSILTDFEEFAVYDCRIKPAKTDKASNSRILFMKYTEYSDRWNEIANIFSHEAILKGSFDKYVESKKAKRGTAEVDSAFLKEIERWRDLLARNIALRNPDLSQRELNFAVQRTIDRIIFLRISEDRGIETYGTLMALQNGNQVYKRMFQIFRQADDRYNSGLFHFQREKGRSNDSLDTLTSGLSIDDKVLKDILKNLYYPDSPYEFSVLPADILGQVYEQFLGKVIRLTPAHHAVVEDKPEVRKAGGVYYTPTYIVDYIVKQTVGKLIEGKKPGPRSAVSKLKILDPACGSGSFLLGAYQFLLDWHRDGYIKDDPKKWATGGKPRLYQSPGNDWRLTTDERKRILLNNIYGVDIDPQAVETTKLSLLLKVLEGEDEQTLGQQISMFQERVLPDLANNIKCGNSLIGPDFYEGQQMSLMDEEQAYRINAFDWQAEFREIMNPLNHPLEKGKPPLPPFTKGGIGGFDAVIGNPPYGGLLSNYEIEYFPANYKLQNYQLDTYHLFLERSFQLVQHSGFIGLIIPNTWLLNLYSIALRKYIFSYSELLNIVHYIFPVFVKATVDTQVIILKNKTPGNAHKTNIRIEKKHGTSRSYFISQKYWKSKEGDTVNIFQRPEFMDLGEKINKHPVLDQLFMITQGTKPFQVGKGKPPQTRKILKEKPYVAETKCDSTFRPLLRGRLIKKYQILWNNNYWISFGDWLAEPRYSANYDAKAKIVIRQTGDSLIATLDREQFIVRDNMYTIVIKNSSIELCYLLGVLNSNLLNWFYQKIINPEKGEALAQVKRGHLARLPVRTIDFSDPTDKTCHDQMVKLVEQMLNLHKQLSKAKVPQTKTVLQRQIETADRQIDQLVYELYRLTKEEIKIVEGSTR
jgi:type I restriction-modification system DNA methylase subunit/predicted type IV restriction endonuclease